MDEVWSDEFGEEGREDIGEEDDGFWGERAHEVECGGEDDYVEDVVYEA